MDETYNFFNESSEQSQVKAKIISKYFSVWSRVIISTAKRNSREPKLAYIDLFAGPGRYDDGTISTPLKVLEYAINDNDLSKSLVTVFNDKEKGFITSLEKTIAGLANISRLKYPPQITNNVVGEEIAKIFEGMKLIPTLFFVDPWGYKGLSLRLVNSVLKDWGCDCIFFFNYNRINMGLNNPLVEEHIDALFGKERGNLLRVKLEKLDPLQRELTIVEELVKALQELGGSFVLPFSFKNESGKRTSHHLIFVSKNIMASESTLTEQGVPALMYNPADVNFPLLFEFNRPLDELGEMLLKEYAGKTISMGKLYIEHSVGKRYISRNYKSILLKLEKENKIITNPSIDKRRKYKGKDTFSDSVEITFP